MNASFIALDWGTTAFRAYLVAADGSVLERRGDGHGILGVPDSDFEREYRRLTEGWPDTLPSIAAGMIGSRQGWREVPYIPAPAGLQAIAAKLLPVETASGQTVHLVPGVSFDLPDSVPEVERGEEAQIVGVIDPARTAPAIVVVPGTHSKWILVEGGHLTWCATFLTGELYAVLRGHSILGRLMRGTAHDPEAFRRGLDYGGQSGPGGLLQRLFSARTLPLFGRLPETGVGAYLSGLLIGSELREARASLTGPLGRDGTTVNLIGANGLGDRYAEALARVGIGVDRWGEEAMVRGLTRIARSAGLVREMAGAA